MTQPLVGWSSAIVSGLWESYTKHTAVTGARVRKTEKMQSLLLVNALRPASFGNNTSLRMAGEDG